MQEEPVSPISDRISSSWMEKPGELSVLAQLETGWRRLPRHLAAILSAIPLPGRNTEYEQVSLDELLSRSDILSVHAPLNGYTENLMTLEKFRKMKKSAIFLNLARGAIVNEPDLYTALTEGSIAGAGLDVLCKEPMNPENPLLKIQDSNKLIITPHIAWAAKETRFRVVDEVVKNIQRFQRDDRTNRVY